MPTVDQRVIDAVIDITSLALQVSRSQEIIEKVTVVRGYAELWVMYPENSRFRDEVSRSLVKLSEALAAKGQMEVATKARSVAANKR